MEELHAFKGAEGDHTVEIHANDDAPVRGAGVQDDVRAARGRRELVPHLLGHGRRRAPRCSTPPATASRSWAICPWSQGKERTEVPVLHAGDIGCVAKLRNTHTNDTLSTRQHRCGCRRSPSPKGCFRWRCTRPPAGDEEKLQAGLHRLHDEDPTFEMHYNAETHETIVSGLGERHLEVTMGKLKRKFGVDAELTKPSIAYRETLRGTARGPGAAQEADRRPRPVRRLLGAFRAAAAGRRLRVRGRDRRRRDPQQIHSGRGQGHSGGGGARRARRLPAGGLQGGTVRRVVPHGGLERNVVQDGGHPRASRAWRPSASRCCSSRSTNWRS